MCSCRFLKNCHQLSDEEKTLNVKENFLHVKNESVELINYLMAKSLSHEPSGGESPTNSHFLTSALISTGIVGD